MAESLSSASVTGDVLYEAKFDPRFATYGRMFVSLILLVSVAGIVLIPFWLLFSMWYYPEFLRRISARVTAQAIEIRKGVFFRKEATIPLNRITDVRLHDGPLMRHYGLRGIAIETAGQSGSSARSEGNLIGVASDGSTALGNLGDGINFAPLGPNSRNSIGGLAPEQGNTIANNAGAGILLDGTHSPSAASRNVSILGNSIFDNGLFGFFAR